MIEETEGNPESSKLVGRTVLALLLLFYAGVIYPLGFLPTEANSQSLNLSIDAFWAILFSLKGFILSSISLIFTGISLIFLYINRSLKYGYRDLQKLKTYKDIGNYSKYLKFYKENTKSL